MRKTRSFALGLVFAAQAFAACAGEAPAKSALVFPGPDGKLVYKPDERGNTIPDFSMCGYMGGGVKIPDVRAIKVLNPASNNRDDTARIQEAIDQISAMRPGRDGLRGALLLKRGTYRIEGDLKIKASGVVLWGEGQGPDGTVLFAAGKRQRAVISVQGDQPRTGEIEGSRCKIADDYVPWGALSFNLESTRGLSVGEAIILYRPSPAEWIHAIKMDQIKGRPGRELKQWQPGEYDLRFERVITAIKGNRITLDAPVVNAMEKKYGGGSVYRYQGNERTSRGRSIVQVGVEHIRVVSEYQKGKENSDEDHATEAVRLANATNSWVRNITMLHLNHGVNVNRGNMFVTVQDCAYLKPVSRVYGGRRYPFNIDGSQFCLIQRCYTEAARHAQVCGARVCGPNVFLDCLNEKSSAGGGPHHRWSVGILWDNLKGGGFEAMDRAWLGSGHGWAGAQQVFWNGEVSSLCIQKPPTAQNYGIGIIGNKKNACGFNGGRDVGFWESNGKHVAPRSLYLKQLEDRLGKTAAMNITTAAQREGTIYEVLKEQLSEMETKTSG